MRGNAPLIGLTGQTGAGKSYVCSLLIELGYDVIDADLVSREVVEPGTPCLAEIKREFGENVVRGDGSLDRRALGAVVFNNQKRLKRLEAIIFPYITARIGAMIGDLQGRGSRGIFLDAPTLFESGINSRCDKVVSVIAPAELRAGRIMKRDGLTAQEALTRISAQHSDEYYRARSHMTIENSGNFEELREKTREMLALIFPREVST